MYRNLCCTVLVILVGGPFCAVAEERKTAPQKTARPLAENSKLAALNARLKPLVASGKLTEDEARELYALVAGPAVKKNKGYSASDRSGGPWSQAQSGGRSG